MGKIVVVENITLDGVMQAPGGKDEDTRGDFRHGGWATPYGDRVMAEKMGAGLGTGGTMLFGRRTYEQFYGFWSRQTDGNPYTEALNRNRKYVASRAGTEALSWENSTLLPGEAATTVAALKQETEGDLVVLGSGELVRSLRAAGLIDTYVLSIYPLTLGTGTRLFAEGDTAYGQLELVEALPTTTGVIIATYRPATGS